jgi:beta-lactamase class A
MTKAMVLFTRFTLAMFACLLSTPQALEANTSRHPVLVQRHEVLQTKLEALSRALSSGSLGISMLDIQSGAQWRINGGEAFPMMSVFKVPVAAAVLERVDQRLISLEDPITLSRAELRGGASGIRDRFRGDRMTFTVRQLLHDSVSRSDNTATDALIRLIGGPAAVTAFLRAHGIEGMRVDLNEQGISDLLTHLGPSTPTLGKEPPNEKDQRLRRGLQAFLVDPRNRSTPDAAVILLKKLQNTTLLSQRSTRHLLDLMHRQTTPRRLRAGLSEGVTLADKCGTSTSLNGVTAAYNDIGIMTWPDGRQVIVAAFLSASKASRAERERLFTDITQVIVEMAQP